MEYAHKVHLLTLSSSRAMQARQLNTKLHPKMSSNADTNSRTLMVHRAHQRYDTADLLRVQQLGTLFAPLRVGVLNSVLETLGSRKAWPRGCTNLQRFSSLRVATSSSGCLNPLESPEAPELDGVPH